MAGSNLWRRRSCARWRTRGNGRAKVVLHTSAGGGCYANTSRGVRLPSVTRPGYLRCIHSLQSSRMYGSRGGHVLLPVCGKTESMGRAVLSLAGIEIGGGWFLVSTVGLTPMLAYGFMAGAGAVLVAPCPPRGRARTEFRRAPDIELLTRNLNRRPLLSQPGTG